MLARFRANVDLHVCSKARLVMVRNCRGVNEWACRHSCSSDDLGDHIQQHTPPTIAYVWQRNDRDRSCMEPLYGNIYYCITQNNQSSILHNTCYLVKCRSTRGS